jgi:hypothetical protein
LRHPADYRLRDLARRVDPAELAINDAVEACRPFLLASEQALIEAKGDIELKTRQRLLRESLLVIAVSLSRTKL